MKTKLAVSIMLLSLLTGILGLAVHIQPATAANEDVRLSVTPSLITQDPPINPPESFFDVYLDISNVTDLFGFDLRVTWTDNTLIALDHDNYNTTLNTIWGAGNWFLVMNQTGGGGGGGGYYRIAALSTKDSFNGTGHLFQLHFKILRNCNFLLETTIDIDPSMKKLSDSLWQAIPIASITPGTFKMNPTKPDLEFEFYDPNPSKPIEYCKYFQVKVYVTDICASLKDYNLVILYDTELLKLTGVDWTDGVLGGPSDGASYTESPAGTINVVDTGGIIWSGDRGLLFTLTFHVEFDDREEHIWHTNPLYDHLHDFIKFTGATLSFNEGTLLMSGITMPADLDIVVKLIRGDVDCNGKVDVFDLRCIAASYDQSSPLKYDLTRDGTIDIFDLVAAATNFGYGGP